MPKVYISQDEAILCDVWEGEERPDLEASAAEIPADKLEWVKRTIDEFRETQVYLQGLLKRH